MYLRPVYTGEQVNSMVKQEKRQFARCMAKLLVAMLKANAHKETNNKKKAQKADLLRDGNRPSAPQLPRSLFSCQTWESKAPEGLCLQNDSPVSISTPIWVWYQLEELMTWFLSRHPSWASLQHLSPYSHLPIFITGALARYRNGNYP